MLQIQETLNQHLESMAFEYVIVGAAERISFISNCSPGIIEGRDVKLTTRLY